MPRSVASRKLKFVNALLYSFHPSITILHLFFFLREIIVMILQACRPTLFLEGSCRRFMMSRNMESEQRTTQSLTLSSSKKSENYRVFLFLPNMVLYSWRQQVLGPSLHYKNVKKKKKRCSQCFLLYIIFI